MPAWMLHVIGFFATTLILAGFAPWLGGPPLWFVVMFAVAAYTGGAVAVDRVLNRTLLRPWVERSAVLHGAAIDVHRIERGATAPTGMDVASRTDRQWCAFDVTIIPRAAADALPTWDPAELSLLDPHCHADPTSPETLDLGIAVHGVEVERGGEFVGAVEITGPARIRFHAALPTTWTSTRLRYGLEAFGRLELDGPGARRAAA